MWLGIISLFLFGTIASTNIPTYLLSANFILYLNMCYDHNKTEIGLLVIVLAILLYVLWLVIEAYNIG